MLTFISKLTRRQVILIVFILSFIPFPTVMISEWKVQVVDVQSESLANVGVEQDWKNYTFMWVEGSDIRQSDENGRVIFPRRFLWASAISRLVSPFISAVGELAHGSSGTYVNSRVLDQNYSGKEQFFWDEKQFLYWYRTDYLPETITFIAY